MPEFNQNDRTEKLIYIQLADWLEDEILAGTFAENAKLPSVAELSAGFKMNHITALKAIGILTDGGIIYKKRGIGMFVSEGAREKILSKRRETFYKTYVEPSVAEAKKLGLTADEVKKLVEKWYGK